MSICLAVNNQINESTQMKMIAVRVGLWFRAAPKGPAEMETRGLCSRALGERIDRPINVTDEMTAK